MDCVAGTTLVPDGRLIASIFILFFCHLSIFFFRLFYLTHIYFFVDFTFLFAIFVCYFSFYYFFFLFSRLACGPWATDFFCIFLSRGNSQRVLDRRPDAKSTVLCSRESFISTLQYTLVTRDNFLPSIWMFVVISLSFTNQPLKQQSKNK